MAKVHFIDVTNRDGVQTSRVCLSKLQKTMLNLYLDRFGVFQSEFGFPFTRHEIHYLNANLELAKQGVIKHMRLAGWLRAMASDVELAFTNCPGLEHVNLSISTSDLMIKHKFQGRLDRKAILASMIESVTLARSSGAKSIGVNAEDASRTDMEFLVEFAIAAVEAGADRIRYCDTLGYDTPMTMQARIAELSRTVKAGIEVHCHNDLGMAVANSVAGAQAAVDSGNDVYVNTCLNGIGERAGNADLISCVLAMAYGSGIEGKTHFAPQPHLKEAWKMCKYASYALGIPIPVNQPGIGSNAFAHESGIHADGALKNRRNYELYDFEELGRGEVETIETGREITVGEYSGIKGFRNVYERLAIKFEDEASATEILDLVRYANVHNQKPLTEEELRFIAQHPEVARKILTTTP